jgi:hypothetical protein
MTDEATAGAETEGATATEEAPARPKRKRKHNLPPGWITPVQFHHELVDRGLARETMSTAQVYIMSRAKKTNGMPVKHFDADGNEYDELQTDPVTGETTTRPGIKLDEGLEWWQNRPKRQPGQKKDKPETKEGEDGEASPEEVQAAEDEADLDEFDEDEAASMEAE